MEASGEHGHQNSQLAAAAGGAYHGSDGSGKSTRDHLYAGAVAQRALYGPSPSRCRGGGPRRVAGGKDSRPPSRLSKMSGAEGT